MGRVATRTTAAVLVALSVLAPEGAMAWQLQGDPEGLPDGSSSAAQVDIDIDVATADGSSVDGTASDIADNVDDQISDLLDAQTILTDAQAAVTLAQGAVDDTQEEIDILEGQSDEVVIGTYLSPPSDNASDLMTTETVGDLAVKQTLLDMRADNDAEVLNDLADARGRLVDNQQDLQDALDEAEQAETDAGLALADLEEAASQQALFAAAIQARIDRGLTEVETLAEIDPEMAAQLASEQQDLIDTIEGLQVDEALEMAGVPPPDDQHVGGDMTITPQGGLAEVSCPTGGSITVAGSMARNLQSLLNVASEQGLALCGSGWRDPNQQIQLRRQNCGASDYAVYQAPSSSCSPPTARPGASMHEQGLAVDFSCGGRGVGRGDSCFVFLSNNAGSHGLYNLPSEPWHWSTDGT